MVEVLKKVEKMGSERAKQNRDDEGEASQWGSRDEEELKRTTPVRAQ